ncbi:MAG: DsbA family protein [Acidimicrobiales bacterium]
MDEIEVFADITCPFAHVGLRRLVQERERQGRSTPTLHLRAWPLELVNDAPHDGRGAAEKGAALREQVAPDMFAHVDPATFPRSSLPALALANAAYRRDVATGEAVSLALRDAVFEEGRDVSDPDVLAEIAAANGIEPATDADAAAVLDDWKAGQARGVIGSPHFFFGDENAFCPTLSITRPEGVLHIEMDEPAFEAFIGKIFG